MDAGEIFPKCFAMGPDMFQEMKFGNKHRTYGKYVKETHSKFKIYDKQWEVKEHNRLIIRSTMRIELELRLKAFQDRANEPNQIYLINDLVDLKKFVFVIHEVLLPIQKISFDYALSPEKTTCFKDVEIIVFIQDPKLRQLAKEKANPKTFRQWSNRYDELRILHVKDDLNANMASLIKEKMVNLQGTDVFVGGEFTR